ncbi:MAG TPA: hypothetical protein PK360_20030 [bacterium]|nr:hypothetical protein [bacterium]
MYEAGGDDPGGRNIQFHHRDAEDAEIFIDRQFIHSDWLRENQEVDA